MIGESLLPPENMAALVVDQQWVGVGYERGESDRVFQLCTLFSSPLTGEFEAKRKIA